MATISKEVVASTQKNETKIKAEARSLSHTPLYLLASTLFAKFSHGGENCFRRSLCNQIA